MISERSIVSNAGLALAVVLAFVSSSCLHSRGAGGQHAPAIKAESHTDALGGATRELEYFEGETPPEIPAALPEQRPGAPTPGHVWISGHHTRRGGQWAWVNGRYALPPRSDVVWVSGHWVSHLRGYAWIPGAWR